MSKDILLKTPGFQKPLPLMGSCMVFGKNAYVFLDRDKQHAIGGPPAELAAILRDWADQIEPVILARPGRRLAEMPPEMGEPETGWPWLVENKPWLFNGINLAGEPYYHYLNGSHSAAAPGQQQLDADMQAVAAAGLQPGAKLADIAEVLFGQREYGGAFYSRVKAVAGLLKNTTTTPPNSLTTALTRKKAA